MNKFFGNILIVIFVAFAILLFVSLCVGIVRADQEFSVKAGYSSMLCESVQSGARIDSCYEIKNKYVGLLTGTGAEFHKVDQVGTIYTIEYYVTGKVYLPWDLYVGGGIGYLDTYIVETHEVKSDMDKEYPIHAVAGKYFNDWFVEGRVTICDLDLETSLPYETEIEKHSRLDSIIVQLGRRW